jgi:AcrR family transcriptional regulator
MDERVKGRRAYHSPRRREQAAVTRRQILEAAQRLFERQGYTVTSMAAIAAEAAVALKTVYVVFDTKSGVLRALWDQLLGGADDQVPVSERAWYLEMMNEPDPRQQLRINARNSRLVKARAASLMRVIRDAAAADADSAALWSLIQSEFHANQATIVASLHEKGALRDDLDLERATDILWTLNHPDIWQLLVVQRGWSPDDYEKWFADAACAQLLTLPG